MMSYEVAVVAAGSEVATMAKSFVIIARDNAQSWYANHCPNSNVSWGDLRDKLCSNFKGVNIAPNHSMDLFSCKQRGERTTPRILVEVHSLEGSYPNITVEAVILAAVTGLRSGPSSSRLARKPATTIAELHEVMEKYCRADAHFHE